ncbi:MAG: ABC transporter ATP-binding protein [Gammaproteobacteria bacterium]|nr:ABC transporter ATP-binding protein [Gammaproteobacteria bacterium]
MSSDNVIRVKNLGKCYHVYPQPEDRLKQLIWRGKKQFYREFWALRDISFEVKKGEMVGVVGRNGAGKSTLLQMVAGTLAPSSGQVEVNGRTAALLELGAGFNAEFTGRENVYLNGRILGLSREEIDARYDDIVSFADIGEFIDQPVKTYSSGMFVRLAFAVQASVEPDILLIDEVLAVGDIFFRQKCYRRIENLLSRGVSMLFVSHAMADIQQYCARAILIHGGQMLFQGSAIEAVRQYFLFEQEARISTPCEDRGEVAVRQHPHAETKTEFFWPPDNAFLNISHARQISNDWARCTAVAICNSESQPAQIFRQGETVVIFSEFATLQPSEVPIGGVEIFNDRGILVHGKHSMQCGSTVPMFIDEGSAIRFRMDIVLDIAVGEYSFEIGLATIRRRDYEHRALVSNEELHERITRVCHVPHVGQFVVTLGPNQKEGGLRFHGLVNLPGECQISVGTSNKIKE